MADARHDRIAYRGVWLDRWSAQAADRALARLSPSLRARVRFSQGSWSGAAASAGTHRGEAAIDLIIAGGTKAEYLVVTKAFRDEMFAAWYRPYLAGVWPSHMHGILIGNANAAASARAQVVSYKAGRNGLAGNGLDAYSYRPAKITNARWVKPTTITLMQFNLPGPDKIGNAANRIKAAMRLVRKANPHLIGWNELEGIRTTNGASKFAGQVDAALGSKWRLVKPTRVFNENYISYRGDRLEVVHQYDDSILESKTGGRHLTRVVFKHANGLVFAVGQTHLVNDGGAQGERDRQAQAKDALASMLAVTAKHNDCPFVISGDMNLSADLTALTGAGMKRTRKYADKSDGRKATYTKYGLAKPSTNTAWEIDHSYVSKHWWVLTYKVLRDLTIRRLYRNPRASDHDATVQSFRA